MKREYEDPTTGRRMSIEYCFDDDILTVTRMDGEEVEVEVYDDTFESHQMPGEIVFEMLVNERDPAFVEVLPKNLLELVEENHEVTLQGRLRKFYEDREYEKYQGWICQGLDCKVNFVAQAVTGLFYEEFVDEESGDFVELMPISSKGVGQDYDYEDEQQWIGVDAGQGNGPVYELFTSNAYSQAYPSLDAFLEDLRPEQE